MRTATMCGVSTDESVNPDHINLENYADDLGIWWILEGQDYPRLWWELIAEN